MHIFHKWDVIDRGYAVFEGNGPLTKAKEEREGVCELQMCRKCTKERGVIHLLNGTKQIVHADFIRRIIWKAANNERL